MPGERASDPLRLDNIVLVEEAGARAFGLRAREGIGGGRR